MIGVSQANRMLHFIAVITEKGARECVDKRTGGARCYTNPFNVNGDGAPYIYLTKKGVIKFGPTLTTAAMLADDKITGIINGTWPKPAAPHTPS